MTLKEDAIAAISAELNPDKIAKRIDMAIRAAYNAGYLKGQEDAREDFLLWLKEEADDFS